MSGVGQYEHILAKRAAVTRGLSPAALHRNFPTLYAQPLPREAQVIVDPTPPLRVEIKELKEKNAELLHENARLQVLVAELSKPLTLRRPITIAAVMEAFCVTMEAHGLKIDGHEWTLDDLRAPLRSYSSSRPRQVCMWLARHICRQMSYPMIGQAFGGRDHTTVLHAYRRAPEIMADDPGLKAVANVIIRSFGAVVPEEMQTVAE